MDSGFRGSPAPIGSRRMETAGTHGCGLPGPLRNRRRERARPAPANGGPATRFRSRSCRVRSCQAARGKLRLCRTATGCHRRSSTVSHPYVRFRSAIVGGLHCLLWRDLPTSSWPCHSRITLDGDRYGRVYSTPTAASAYACASAARRARATRRCRSRPGLSWMFSGGLHDLMTSTSTASSPLTANSTGIDQTDKVR